MGIPTSELLVVADEVSNDYKRGMAVPLLPLELSMYFQTINKLLFALEIDPTLR